MTADADAARVRILRADVVHRGWQTVTVYRIALRRRDGTTEDTVREVEDHGNSVAVLPFDAERGTVLLTRQFRLAAHLGGHPGMLLEVCAGMIEEGESADTAVLREAREEMGVTLRDLTRVAGIFVSPGASREHATLYTAHYSPADRTGAGGGVDAGEDIEVIEMPLAEAARGIRDGTIVDAKTVLLIQALLLEQAPARG